MILDPYSGPRGWSEGLRRLGLTDVGIELDAAACDTAAAAGHRTIRADVASFPLAHLVGRVDGLIMSPPCQAFSMAGRGRGRQAIPEIVAVVTAGDWSWHHDDDRVRHVLEVGRWAETLRPTWIACEQVPPVLPIWQAYADRWRSLGWSTWAGILLAADYGVPQTRKRAFLIARTDGRPIGPPPPTHCKGGAIGFFGELLPWVSMAEALGWPAHYELHRIRGAGMTERHGTRPGRRATEPAPTIESGCWRRMAVLRTNQDSAIRKGVTRRDERSVDRPAPTLTQMSRSWVWRDGTERRPLELAEALMLQGFPANYPVQGTKTKQFEQVGNAVPPPLAAAVIAAVTGVRVHPMTPRWPTEQENAA